MRYRAIFFYASRLRDEGNRLIIGALKEAGLTDIAPSHGDILAHLLAGGPCHMGVLARRIRRTRSTMTALVEKLERAGYVERRPDPADARGVLVCLTDRGKALAPVMDGVSRALEALVASRLSAEEADALERLLSRCVGEEALSAPLAEVPGAVPLRRELSFVRVPSARPGAGWIGMPF